MFTQTIQLAKDLEGYNRGRREEQKALENTLEFLTIKGLLDPATLNLLIEEISKIDRRPRKEEE
jgi:ribonucleotide reductase beta subunit family protein with ferritin-like domain